MGHAFTVVDISCVSIQKCFLANISFAKLITESDSKEDIGDDDKGDQDFLSDVHWNWWAKQGSNLHTNNYELFALPLSYSPESGVSTGNRTPISGLEIHGFIR